MVNLMDGNNRILGKHILVECNKFISSKKHGSIPNLSRCLEINIILILSCNLELGSSNIKIALKRDSFLAFITRHYTLEVGVTD